MRMLIRGTTPRRGPASRLAPFRFICTVLLFWISSATFAQDSFLEGVSVTITNPPDGKFLTFPSVIRLRASVSVPSNLVTTVLFWESTNHLVGAVSEPPYNLDLTNQFRNGNSYYFTAQASDAEGNSVTSAPVKVTVVQSTRPPTVVMSNLVTGEFFLEGASIKLGALVDTDDGSENQVDFFSNNFPIGSAQGPPPYELVVSTLVTGFTSGTNKLTAQYRDNIGYLITSSPVQIYLTPIHVGLPVLLSDGTLQVHVEGLTPNRFVRLQTSTDLVQWTGVATNTTTSTSLDYTISPTDPARFYKIVQ
jgi:hypothetical protein